MQKTHQFILIIVGGILVLLVAGFLFFNTKPVTQNTTQSISETASPSIIDTNPPAEYEILPPIEEAPIQPEVQETLEQESTPPAEETTVSVSEGEVNPLFTPITYNDSLSFCAYFQDVADQLLANRSPSDYIDASPDKYYLDIWKNLFLERNEMGPSYFDEHIRIEKSGIIDLEKNSYFRVQYYFIADWASAQGLGGGDIIPLYNSDGSTKTYNQLRDQFNSYWEGPGKEMKVKDEKGKTIFVPAPYISSVRVNDVLIDHLISCKQALKKIQEKVSGVDAGKMLFENDTLLLNGFSSSNKENESNCQTVVFDFQYNNVTAYNTQECAPSN